MPIERSKIQKTEQQSFKPAVSSEKGKMARGNSVTIGSRTSGAKRTSQVWMRGVKKSQSAPPKTSAERNPRAQRHEVLKERVISEKGGKSKLEFQESLKEVKDNIDKLPKNRRDKIDKSADKEKVNEIYDQVKEEVILLRDLSSRLIGVKGQSPSKELLKEFEDLQKSLRNWLVMNR